MAINDSWCKQGVICLCVILPLLGGATLLLYSLHDAKTEQVLRQRSDNDVRMLGRLIGQRLHGVARDLEYLATMHEAGEIVSGGVSPAIDHSLLTFSKAKEHYSQIRYLDITGMELVRVDRVDGRPVITPRDKLQFKGDRYYAAEGLSLTRGDVYISPLDLNMEHGTVEVPHKPMLRFVMPVFDDHGNRKGMVIINYLGAALLGLLDEVGGEGEMMLLNQDGYWLGGGPAPFRWAFMFADRKHQTFGSLFPEEWRAISDADAGQFITTRGLYTHARLCLSDVVSAGTGGSVVGGRCWTVVSHVGPRRCTPSPTPSWSGCPCSSSPWPW